MRLLFTADVPDAGRMLERCQAFAVTRQCLHNLALERLNGYGLVPVSDLPLLLLLVAACGLLRGRRFAVWLAAAVNVLLAVLAALYFGVLPQAAAHPAPGRYGEVTVMLTLSALVPVAMAVLLVALRRHFTVLPAPRSVRRYLLLLVGPVIALVLFALLIGWTPFAMMAYHKVGTVFWLVALLASLRPLLGGTGCLSHVGDGSRARALLTAGGGGSLSFMATWAGNSYWFDPVDGRGIAYRVVGRVALAIGGPFGAPPPHDKSIERFARFCDDCGWIPVFYSVNADLRPLFDRLGWSTTTVAEETVIRPGRWTTTGRMWQDIRSSVNRAERAGIRAEWTTYAALPLSAVLQIFDISEQWVAEKDLPEMGFTLGGVDELRDPAVRLMLAVDATGRIEGVTSWLPSYRDGRVIGWTLDFMRRRPDSINGVMEFLIAQAAMRMKEDGIEFMSLSAAPLAHTAGAQEGGASGMDRVLAQFSRSLEPVYGFRSLLRFKQKFQPELQPLVMAYPDPVALPAIGVALARAYLPRLSVRQAAALVVSRG